MNISKLIFKYSIFLLGLIVIERFVEPYAMKFYYTFHKYPDLMPETIQQFQSVVLAVNFVFNLFVVFFMIFDSKNKRGIDWIIFMITFIYAESGILIFIIWQVYKSLNKKHEAQHAI